MAVGLGLVPALVALGTAALGGSATSTAAATSSEVAAPAVTVSAEENKASSAGTTSAVVGSSEPAATAATVRTDSKDDVASRFAGSVLFAQLSANLNVFDAGLQLMQNPTVDSFVLLAPRYKVTDWLAVRARLSLSYEFTNADSTTYDHELQLGDGIFGAVYTGIPAFFGIKANVGAQLTLPFSKTSRAKTLYLSPALTAELGREFEHVAGGKLSFKATGSYARPVYGEITPRLLDAPAYAPHCYGGAADCGDQLSGAANVRDLVSWGLVGAGTWGPFSATLTFNMYHQFPYQFGDLPGVQRSDTRPSVRMISWAVAALGYDITDYVGVELSYSMMRNLMSGDGTWGSPFYDANQDMRLNLGATLDLERFYRVF